MYEQIIKLILFSSILILPLAVLIYLIKAFTFLKINKIENHLRRK